MSLADDRWLIPDVAAIKQALKDGVVSELRLVPGDMMLANCLTKSGESGESLLEVLRTGRFKLPGGWKRT